MHISTQKRTRIFSDVIKTRENFFCSSNDHSKLKSHFVMKLDEIFLFNFVSFIISEKIQLLNEKKIVTKYNTLLQKVMFEYFAILRVAERL